jgi:hypothetical protein
MANIYVTTQFSSNSPDLLYLSCYPIFIVPFPDSLFFETCFLTVLPSTSLRVVLLGESIDHLASLSISFSHHAFIVMIISSTPFSTIAVVNKVLVSQLLVNIVKHRVL